MRTFANKLVVISAPSGAGKTTLCARLLQNTPELMLSVSTTTRAPRGTEMHGVEYFFVTREEFRDRVDAGRFAEWAEVHGNFYGTTKDFVDEAFRNNRSLLLDIDVQGAHQLRQSYPENTLLIFIQPPSMDELERRLRLRGTDTEEVIQKRLRASAAEMAQASTFDHVITNDSLDRAYFELQTLVNFGLRGETYAGKPSGPKGGAN